MVHAVMHALAHHLPAAFNHVKVHETSEAQAGTQDGETFVSAPDIEVHVCLTGRRTDSVGRAEAPVDFNARTALTFTHELFLHARPFFVGMSNAFSGRETRLTSEIEDHAIVISPVGPGNEYFRAVRSVLPELPDDATRRKFLQEYLEELRTYPRRFLIDDEGRQLLEGWVLELETAAADLGHGLWRQRTRFS
jgi:hypothetical protein